MSAELIVAGLIYDTVKPLDWQAAEQWIATADPEVLANGVEEAFGETEYAVGDPQFEASLREQVTDILNTLKALLDDPTGGYTVRWKVRGAYVTFAGGTSHGDSPCDDFDAINNAWHFEGMLKALGIETGDTPEGPVPAAPVVSDEALLAACQEAADAAYGDSNDGEIEALREALDLALARLGLSMPEGRDPDDEDA